MAISGVNGFEPRIRGSHRRERLEKAKTQEGALGRAHLAPAAAVRRSQEFSDFNDGLNSISLRQRNRRKGNTGASTPQWHFLPRRPHSKEAFFFVFSQRQCLRPTGYDWIFNKQSWEISTRPLELPYTFPLTTLGVYKNQKPQCSSKLNSPLEGHKLGGEESEREGGGKNTQQPLRNQCNH